MAKQENEQNVAPEKKKKRHKKWPIVLGCVLGGVTVLGATLWVVASMKPAVPKNYWDKQVTDGKIEAKYASLGDYEVSSSVFVAPEQETVDGKTYTRHFKAFYPSDESQVYPLVVMVNGTGVPYTKYEQLFEHLASWGFVVIGTDAATSWDGAWASKELDFALETSSLSKRIDAERIAVGGHSQGGEGTYNAVTDFENGKKYRCLFALSATSNKLACGLDWSHNIGEDNEYGYDLSKVNIPALMFAGTGNWDAGTSDNPDGICPLYSLQENYAAYPEGVPAVTARRKNTDHGDMLWRSDPYVTAWLCYWLKDDQEAGKAFFGDEPELAQNQNWQDFQNKE